MGGELNATQVWDYDASVERVRPKVTRWWYVDGEVDVYHDLREAREQLKGARAALASGRGWESYCKDVGLAKSASFVTQWVLKEENYERSLTVKPLLEKALPGFEALGLSDQFRIAELYGKRAKEKAIAIVHALKKEYGSDSDYIISRSQAALERMEDEQLARKDYEEWEEEFDRALDRGFSVSVPEERESFEDWKSSRMQNLRVAIAECERHRRLQKEHEDLMRVMAEADPGLWPEKRRYPIQD